MMRAALCLLALTLATPVAQAAATDEARAHTEALIKTLGEIKTANPTTGVTSAADKKHNIAVFKRIDDYFRLDAFADAAVAPHRKKFTAAQAKKFKAIFVSLIRLAAYPRAGEFLRTADVQLKKARATGKDVAVDVYAYLEEEDFESDSSFIWTRAGNGWRVHDILFDGASLLQDYRNQFGRLLEKNGAAKLVEKIGKCLKKTLDAKGTPL